MVIVHEDGIISYSNPYSEKTNYIPKIDPSDIMSFLKEKVTLDKNVTLRSYFEIFNNYPILINLDNFITSFLDNYNENKDRTIAMSDSWCIIESIDIGKYSSLHEEERHDISHYINVNGYGYDKNEENKIKTERNYTSIGIEFGYFMEMIDIPLKIINDKYLITKNNYMYSEEYVSDESTLTLFDFITNIIYELSFNGDVCSVDEKSLELEEIVNNIENNTSSIEDIFGDDFRDNFRFKLDISNYKNICEYITWMEKQRKELVLGIKKAKSNNMNKNIIEYNYNLYLLFKNEIKAKSNESRQLKYKIKNNQKIINQKHLESKTTKN